MRGRGQKGGGESVTAIDWIKITIIIGEIVICGVLLWYVIDLLKRH